MNILYLILFILVYKPCSTKQLRSFRLKVSLPESSSPAGLIVGSPGLLAVGNGLENEK